jgi:ABC-type microcin C transport system duplicated ATPase subunit YejF
VTALLEARGVTRHFTLAHGLGERILRRPKRVLRAVEGVDLAIARGETLGLIGESGCGKSTLGRTILRLIPATGGEVSFDGLDLLTLPRAQLAPLRRRMQIVFQDPAGSLNPRLRVETAVGEALAVHRLVRGRAALRARVAELLRFVGLGSDALARYPHEFSAPWRPSRSSSCATSRSRRWTCRSRRRC